MAPPLTRRELLHGLAATGAAGGAFAAADAFAAAAGAAETPRRGGRVRVAGMSSSSADTLDPARGGLSTDYIRHFMLYSGLTRLDFELRPQLALAETFDSADQRIWRIVLRSGVRFHDGRALTARDVAFSLARHKDPATGSKVKTVAEQFESIDVLGPRELRLTLATPNADLPAMLGTSHFLIIPDGTTDFSRGIGCGPHRLREFRPGVRTIVSRNPEYWRDGRPYLDEVELIGIPDEMARVNALLSGDVQMAIAVNPRSTRRLRASPRHDMMVTKSGLYTNLITRLDAPRTGNPDFALAIKHLLDRPTILRALFRGYASIGNDQPIPPGHRYHDPSLPQRPYDPERARFHLKRAGLLGIRLPVYASPAAEGSVEMAAMLQQSAAVAGFNIAVNRVPADGYWSNHWMKHPLSFGNTNPRPTADLLFSTFFKSDAPWNESAWRNPRFDALLLAARSESREPLRREIYGEMQRLVHHHSGIGIPAFIDNIDGFDRRIRGLRSLPLGGLMGYQFSDNVWLAASA